jgi:hypothetical protein
MRTSIAFLAIILVIAACGSPAAPAPTTTVVATADPNAATSARVASTIAHLATLSKEASSANDAGVLIDLLAMQNTLEQEQAWIGTHADVTRAEVQVYQQDISNAINALKTALASPTTASIGAAGSAVLAARAAGSNLAGQ